MKLRLAVLCLLFSSNVFAASVDQETLKGESFKSFQTLAKGLFFLESMHVDAKKSKLSPLVENALRGAARSLDQHSAYLSADALNQFRVNTKGKFGGIGVIVTLKKNVLQVVRVVSGSPAERAGVRGGDIILAIDQKVVNGLGDPMQAMRGPVGSKVELKISRGQNDILEFVVRREIVRIQSVISKELSPGFLRIQINSFQEATAQALSKAISAAGPGLKGVVLDLRGNPGGLLSKSIEIADMFLRSGVLLFTVGRSKSDVQVEYATPATPYASLPMVVLIDKASASASEIVAGIFQDYKRAVLMGEPSYGKGSVQTLVSLPNGAGLKVTVAKYRLPSDRTIQDVGIKPDISLLPTAREKWLEQAHKTLIKLSKYRPAGNKSIFKVPQRIL